MKKGYAFILSGILLLCSCSGEKEASSVEESLDFGQSDNASGSFAPDFAGERGTVDEQFGIAGSVKDGFVYYKGEDGFYEYDPEDKESVRVTGSNLGINAVSCGFIHYEPNYSADITGGTGTLQYLNFKGEALYEHYFEAGPEHGLIAYDNRLYYNNYYYDVKKEEKVKLFPDDASDYSYDSSEDDTSIDESKVINISSYVLSDDHYMRIKSVGKKYSIERLKLSDNSIDTIALPENIDVCDLAVDRNSDIYVSSVVYLEDGNWTYEMYKIKEDGGAEKIENVVPNSMHFTVLNGDIFYMDTNDSLMIYDGKNTAKAADNVFDFAVLNERFILYKTMINSDRSDTSVYEGMYLYDRNDNTNIKLKTVTEE